MMEEITNHAVAKSPSLAPNQKSTVFTEGFEGATAPALPAGWTQVGTWRTSTGLTGTPPISAHTGQLGLLAHWDQTTFTGWCFSPDFPLVSGTTYTISFYFMAPGYQNEPDNLIAYIGQNRTAAIATTGTKIFE
ncbi:MAG: hypothetical protein LBH22_02160, partial [Bacteroidales bacterium]|nr:hypothetical protein [Bacteroidales bacterium]